jgi:DNA anti-recombination protein RmuC
MMTLENELKDQLDSINSRLLSANKNIDDLSEISSKLKSSTNSLSEAADSSINISNKLQVTTDNLDSISDSANKLFKILERTELSLNESNQRNSKEILKITTNLKDSFDQTIAKNDEHLRSYQELLEEKFQNLTNLILILIGIIAVLVFWLFLK